MRPEDVRPSEPVVRACYVSIPGTHGDDGEQTGLWWQPGSPFERFMYREGLCHISENRPFTWSTDLNGHRFWRRWLGLKDKHRDWMAGGYALSYYLWPVHESEEYVELPERNLIAHSHGGQVVFYACALGGLKINRLITVGTPIRADMRAVIEQARPNIGQWLHIRGDVDATSIWGSIGDGAARIEKRFGAENWFDEVEGIGHSGVLYNPDLFYHWRNRGWIEFLRGEW